MRSGDERALLELDQLSVITPAGATLVKHCSLTVQARCNLLVTGPNGSGKSSLVRVLRGLWPNVRGGIAVAGGRGEWQLCRNIFFVPQQPFLSYASLMEQLVYPLSIDGVPLWFSVLVVVGMLVRTPRQPQGCVASDHVLRSHL